ncbi:MAG: 6-phosphofructokinase [Gemmatimonadetes bacterium]|nr:6-phosphofructokinase [Gemmatimonadota bacterium]
MAKGKQIGILTGGGDVPGLNSVIKSVVYRASEMGREVIGFRKGWEGLTHSDLSEGDDPRYVWRLSRDNTRRIDRSGGTVLHTSRTNPKRVHKSRLPSFMSDAEIGRLPENGDSLDFTSVVLEKLQKLDIGTLITIGGDDTLSFSAHLHDAGMPVIAIPKTMDNDVRGTEYCIGFSTAITRAKDLITRQRTTLGSHERIGVFRIFGRDAGFTALYTSYVTSTRCLIPEFSFDPDHLCELLVADKRDNPSGYSMVVASEGAVWKGQELAEYGEADAYGHKKKVDIGHALAEEIRSRTGEETMTSDLTYDLRSGDPDSIDHMVAITFANIALDLVASGVVGRMVAIRDGNYAHTTIPDPSLGPRTVNIAQLYNPERYRPNYASKIGSPLLLSNA